LCAVVVHFLRFVAKVVDPLSSGACVADYRTERRRKTVPLRL